MTVIKIKSSSVAGKEPTAGQLETAELAVNLADAKLYTKDGGGTVIALGGSTGSGGTDDRPDSPTVGDLFFDTDLGVLLYWDGSAWQEVAGDIEVPTSQPASPEDGQLWWNTDDNTLYIWYEDGDTGQWVIAVPQGLGSDFDEATADGLYLQLDAGISSQDVVGTGTIDFAGDLTLGTDKIRLDASTGNMTIAGQLFTQGGSGGPYVLIGQTITFNTDADNDANYTVTGTEEYTETETYEGPRGKTLEREVTKTREIRTYTGPTLDVKEELQKLIQRAEHQDVYIKQLTAVVADLGGDVSAMPAPPAE